MQTLSRGRRTSAAARYQDPGDRHWQAPPEAENTSPAELLLADLRRQHGPIRGRELFERVLAEARAGS